MRAGGRSVRLAVGQGVQDEIAVVTAYNPASRPAEVQSNRAASRRLLQTIRGGGLSWLPARAHGTGDSARRWDEPGFALTGRGAVAAAVALGQALGQNAVLAAIGGTLRLIVTRGGFCGHAVGDTLP